jgi:hypothetical protein
MKTIKKEGEIKTETFKCLICGCRYESDEYKLFEEIYVTEKKSKIKIIDECPECISKVYKKI